MIQENALQDNPWKEHTGTALTKKCMHLLDSVCCILFSFAFYTKEQKGWKRGRTKHSSLMSESRFPESLRKVTHYNLFWGKLVDICRNQCNTIKTNTKNWGEDNMDVTLTTNLLGFPSQAGKAYTIMHIRTCSPWQRKRMEKLNLTSNRKVQFVPLSVIRKVSKS